MGRIRTIKPEFPHSESIGRLSRDARLLFIQLWTLVDDSGRARGGSRLIASLLYPYDPDAPMLMEGWLSELEHESHIRRYQADGDTYLEIANFLKHQKIDKPTPSKLPKFVEDSPKPTRTVAKNSLGREGIIGRDQGGEGDERASAPPPEKPIALIPDETPVTQEPYDPAADPFDSIPEGLTTVQYATEVFRDVGISPGYALKVKLADTIPILAREEACSDAEAVRRLRDRMREAQRAGPVKWNFWLEDGGWKLTQGNTLSIEGLEDGV